MSLFRQRFGQLGAVGIALAGLALAVALGSYNPHDPSMNTATSRAATNLLGVPGAMAADLLLQYFGAAGAVPVLAMLAWAYRVAAARPLRLGMRMCFPGAGDAGAGFGAGDAAGSVWSAAGGLAWPGGAGLGGAVGFELGGWSASLGRGLIGPMGGLAVLGGEAVLALLLLMIRIRVDAGGVAGGGAGRRGRGTRVGAGRAGVRPGRSGGPGRGWPGYRARGDGAGAAVPGAAGRGR